jgi:hypothetical protein
MLGELFWAVAGGIYLVGHSIKGDISKLNEAEQDKIIMDYMRTHTDMELEKRLRIEVGTPSIYNEIWERIEDYKRNDGAFTKLGGSSDDLWASVCESRLPLFDNKGRIPKRTMIEYNHGSVLRLLMHTYNKRVGGEAYNAICQALGRNNFHVPLEYISKT